jgi:hypothetical protein
VPPTPGLKPPPPSQQQPPQGVTPAGSAGHQYLSPLPLIREGGHPATPATPLMPPTSYAGSRPSSPGPANMSPPPHQQQHYQYPGGSNTGQYSGAPQQQGDIPAGGGAQPMMQQQPAPPQQQVPMYTGVPGMQPAPFTGPQPYIRFYNA